MKSKQQQNLKIKLVQKSKSGKWQSISLNKMQECEVLIHELNLNCDMVRIKVDEVTPTQRFS
jgi:hypothetical protein